MMTQILAVKRIAILATDGFEQSELVRPQKVLADAGASDPTRLFEQPKDVVAFPEAGKDAKLALLHQWESDARAIANADEEGMLGDQPSNLEDVRKAVHAIEPPDDADIGTPTKHGG